MLHESLRIDAAERGEHAREHRRCHANPRRGRRRLALTWHGGGADLRGGRAARQQHDSKHLQVAELVLEDEAEEDGSEYCLQRRQNLVRRRVDVREDHEDKIIVDKVDCTRSSKRHKVASGEQVMRLRAARQRYIE